jgi:hypothetical protein
MTQPPRSPLRHTRCIDRPGPPAGTHAQPPSHASSFVQPHPARRHVKVLGLVGFPLLAQIDDGLFDLAEFVPPSVSLLR